MAWVCLDTVNEAMALCGSVDLGRAPDAPIGEIARVMFNSIRASRNLQGMTCFGASVLTITADGGASYTMGATGDNATRPDDIAEVQWTTGDSNIYTLQKLPFVEYQGLPSKDTTTNAPSGWAVDGAYPLLRLYVYPAPQTGTIRVIARTAFAEIANLSDPILDPPSYREAWQFLLADKLNAIPGIGTGEIGKFAAIAENLVSSILTANVANNIPRVSMPLSYRYSTDGEGSSGGTSLY